MITRATTGSVAVWMMLSTFPDTGCRLRKLRQPSLSIVRENSRRIRTKGAADICTDSVAEAAVVGITDELTGQAVNAFVALKDGQEASDQTKKDLTLQVRKSIGPFAAPKAIFVVPDLPKTRSGKIMRRILRKILAGEEDQLGDTSTVSRKYDAYFAGEADTNELAAVGPFGCRQDYRDSARGEEVGMPVGQANDVCRMNCVGCFTIGMDDKSRLMLVLFCSVAISTSNTVFFLLQLLLSSLKTFVKEAMQAPGGPL